MALQSLDIVAPFGHHHPVAPGAHDAAAGRQAHRRVQVHRLQGLPGRLHGLERPARRGRQQRRRLRQPERPDAASLDGDAFFEVEPEDGNLEWLIRKDGCMHCEDPGCLKACPSPGAIVQVRQRHRRLHQENCIGCGYCVKGCPFDVPAHHEEGQQGLQVHAVLRPRRRGAGAGLRQDLPDRRHRLRHQGRHGRLRPTNASPN